MPSPEDLEAEEWADDFDADFDREHAEVADEDGCTSARCVCGAEDE